MTMEQHAAIQAQIVDALLDADINDWEKREEAEKRRRAALSPKKKQLQACVDAVDDKLTEWDDALNTGDRAKGLDQKTLWAALNGLMALHRDGDVKADEIRWFASYVRNQIMAKIDTID